MAYNNISDKMKKQVAYNRKWNEQNREHKRYLSKRSTAKSFLRVATKEEIPTNSYLWINISYYNMNIS